MKGFPLMILNFLPRRLTFKIAAQNEDGGNHGPFINIDKRTKYPKLTINHS